MFNIMDTLGRFILNKNGVKIVHKQYIEAFKKNTSSKVQDINYMPGIRSLVMRHQYMCEYCNNIKKMNPERTSAIQLCLNIGVQICQKCLQEHKHHISFLHNSILHDQLSWWQFQSLNDDNPFVKTLAPDKVLKNLVENDGNEYKMCVCAPIFISRKRRDLTFPMYIKKTDDDYFDVTHIQEVSLKTFCKFHPTLDKKIVVEHVKNYLSVE